MPTLRIELLGDFCLKLDDQLITSLSSPRLQALLAYLVLHRAAPQARQQIAFLFWPDFPEANARNNLRQLLFEFRRALPNAESFLDLEGSTLCWRSDASFSLDVAEFENALTAAERAGQNRDQEREQAALETSALLYHGDLLPSCYDDWIVPVRETLRQKAITALERLIELQERQHDYRQALSHAQHLLRHDPLREVTYRCLMRLHALSGDRVGVVRVYNTCVQVLQRELSVQASPVTIAEYEHWLKESLSPSRSPDRAQPPSATPRRHNLPFELTTFIGRAREASQVKELIASHRLVTLTGSGGVGKTRLALHVAADVLELFPNGVWLVDLAPLSDPALVPQAVATALEVREAPGSPLIDTLANYVREKHLLLILDNCEHLVKAVRHLAKTLVETAPNLRVLATSRESLGIAGEVLWRVPSLPMPEERLLEEHRTSNTPASIMQSESMRLFVDRATAALPTFTVTNANVYDVAKICRQLDGIPLAIELAAVRVKMLSPQQIAARLDRSFDLLTVGSRTALPRHRTLRATMDWSYQLLSEEERILLRRLSIFAGGFTVEAVEQVCGEQHESEGPIHPSMILDLLSGLIDKSLVVVEQPDTMTRYRLLETVRQYGLERLQDSGELERIRSRHAEYYANFGEQAEPKLRSSEQNIWFNSLDKEHDNLRAVFQRCQAAEVNAQLGLRLAGAVWWFWYVFGSLSEGHRWLDAMLGLAGAAEQTRARAKALCGAAILAGTSGHFDVARSWAEEGHAISQELSDPEGIANGLFARCAVAYFQKRDVASIRPGLEECLSISRSIGYKWGIGESLHLLGHVAAFQGDHAQARSFFEESMATFRSSGDSSSFAHPLRDLGREYGRLGDYGSARAVLEEALTATRELGNTWTADICLRDLGSIALSQGDFAVAFSYLDESLALARDLGDNIRVTQCSTQLGNVLLHQERYPEAKVHLEKGLAVSKEHGMKLENAQALQILGHFAMHQGDPHRAGTLCREGLALFYEVKDKEGIVQSLEGLAQAAIVETRYERAARLFGAAETLRQTVGVSVPPYLLNEYTSDASAARAQLGDNTFNVAWHEGKAMALEQAVEYALQDS